VCRVVTQKLGEGSCAELLVELGQLTGHDGLPPSARHGGQVRKQRDEPVRRLEHDDRQLARGDRGEALPPLGSLSGQEPEERVAVRGDAGAAERRGDRGGARDHHDRKAARACRRDQRRTGIADRGRPGVGHEGHVAARFEQPQDRTGPGGLRVRVVAQEACVRAHVGQERPRAPGVLRGDDRHGPERIRRAR
jgi:hypothetical protein